jgi:hypothetical protein
MVNEFNMLCQNPMALDKITTRKPQRLSDIEVVQRIIAHIDNGSTDKGRHGYRLPVTGCRLPVAHYQSAETICRWY